VPPAPTAGLITAKLEGNYEFGEDIISFNEYYLGVRGVLWGDMRDFELGAEGFGFPLHTGVEFGFLHHDEGM
jgi:hypothetical protein